MNEEYQKTFEDLIEEFHDRVAKKTARLNELIKTAAATYDDANTFSIMTGESLSETLLNGITDDLIFDGKLPYGAAKEIIFPMIHDNYELVTKYCEGVQNSLNEKAGIHLKYIAPEFDQDRAYGIVYGITTDKFEKIKNSFLGETIINQSQDIVTQSVRTNAKFQYETGMHPKIIRTVAGGCCDWCANLAGTYDYETVKATGNDVWRRHRYCRCTVTYVPEKGKSKTVWANKKLNSNESVISGARITNPDTKEALEFAESYYEEIRHKSTDYLKVAEKANITVQEAKNIKDYLFVNKSLYIEELKTWVRFDPDAAIAQSWQRLSEGNPLPHDFTLIKHEMLEMKIKKENPNISHYEAHNRANMMYNYIEESRSYYVNLKKSNKKR